MIKFAMRAAGFAAVTGTFNRLRQYAGSGGTTYIVGTNVEYAPYVEFGTRHMSAQPYLRPAVEEVRSNIPRYVSRSSSLDDAVRLAAVECEAGARRRAPVDTGNLRNSIRSTRQ